MIACGNPYSGESIGDGPVRAARGDDRARRQGAGGREAGRARLEADMQGVTDRLRLISFMKELSNGHPRVSETFKSLHQRQISDRFCVVEQTSSIRDRDIHCCGDVWLVRHRFHPSCWQRGPATRRSMRSLRHDDMPGRQGFDRPEEAFSWLWIRTSSTRSPAWALTWSTCPTTRRSARGAGPSSRKS